MKHATLIVLCLGVLVGMSFADIEVGESDWEQTLATHPQTFVKFYNPRCGWCQKLAPLWTELGSAFEGALHIVSVDVSKHQKLATDQGISSVPTMKLYNGKHNIADYSGPRTQSEMASWVFPRLLPITLTYNSPAWARYTQTQYALPSRFIYLYAEGNKPDTSALYEVIKQRGIFATSEIPSDKVQAFLRSYSLKSLPVLVTSVSGRLSPVPSNDIDSVITDALVEKTEGKKFGTGTESDSHSTFTFFFFLVGIIGLGVFAYRKISFPQRHHDPLKTV